MTVKPTVFIPSTSSDLPAHRNQVSGAGRCMGYDSVGMEAWSARDADAETVCLRELGAREPELLPLALWEGFGVRDDQGRSDL